MRKLAKELGVEAMSLYNHVANKDDLLDGMIDIVFSEIEPPAAGGDWKAELRKRAVSTREALQPPPLGDRRDGGPRPTTGPPTSASTTRCSGCLRAAGFSIEMTVHAMSVQDAYIYGFALQQTDMSSETPEDFAAEAQRQMRRLRRRAGRLPAPRRGRRRLRRQGRLRLRRRVPLRPRRDPRPPGAAPRRGLTARGAAPASAVPRRTPRGPARRAGPGPPSASIAVIRPSTTVKASTATGTPSSVATKPAAPSTIAGCAVARAEKACARAATSRAPWMICNAPPPSSARRTTSGSSTASSRSKSPLRRGGQERVDDLPVGGGRVAVRALDAAPRP